MEIWTFVFMIYLCLRKCDANRDILFPLSTSLHSIQCGREPLYFIASNHFTSHELTACIDAGSICKKKRRYGLHRVKKARNVQSLNCY